MSLRFASLHYTTLHKTTSTTTQLHSTTLLYTILHYTTLHYTILHYTTLHYTSLHYTTLHYTTTTTTTTTTQLHSTTIHSTTLHYTKLHCTTLHYTTLHYTTLHYTTLPSTYTSLHYTTLHYTTATTTTTQLHSTTRNYTTLHYIPLHSTTKRTKERRPQAPFGPSVDSLCHPWFTTTNLSYRFPIFETSATALCGTTGICSYWFLNIIYIYIYTYILCICIYIYMYNLFPTFTLQIEGFQFQLLFTSVNFNESLSIRSYVRFAAEPNTYGFLLLGSLTIQKWYIYIFTHGLLVPQSPRVSVHQGELRPGPSSLCWASTSFAG